MFIDDYQLITISTLIITSVVEKSLWNHIVFSSWSTSLPTLKQESFPILVQVLYSELLLRRIISSFHVTRF